MYNQQTTTIVIAARRLDYLACREHEFNKNCFNSKHV